MLNVEQRRRPIVQSRALSVEERDYYRQLISQLVAERKARGLSQAAMDDVLGVSEGMVAKWEAAARLPGAFFLMCWGKALGVRIKIEKELA